MGPLQSRKILDGVAKNYDADTLLDPTTIALIQAVAQVEISESLAVIAQYLSSPQRVVGGE
jgi:hypothetical protein